MRAITDTRPRQRARHRRARPMEITLHIGAHRTATTTFQHYMRESGPALRRAGIGFWGPLRTRGGLFTGLLPDGAEGDAGADMARARIAAALDRAERTGTRHLIVSEENILGLAARNIRLGRLYPQAGDRIARLARAFDGRLTRLAVTVRPQHGYWPSAIAYAVHRGHPVPDAARLERIARAPRGWRDVLRELAAAQGAAISVLPFGTGPETAMAVMTGGAVTPAPAATTLCLNAAPDRAELRAALAERGADTAPVPAGEGRWQPFDPDQRAMLAESWLDDEFWLAAGAGGLATYHPHGRPASGTKHQPERAGHHLPPGLLGRGHGHGIEERRMVGSR